MTRSLSITFVGGARSVTGSHFLVDIEEDGHATRIAIDCGLRQGDRFCESSNLSDFPYSVGQVDSVFFTHAHADHIGLFPKFVKEGFNRTAYATPPTADLMPVMLEDGASIIAREARACGEEPPYTKEDVEAAMRLVEPLEYRQPITVAENVTVTLYNAGHILGSACVLIDAWGTRLLFTGDLGRTPAALVPDPDIPPGPIHYLITESVYGNRVHESAEQSERALLKSIENVIRDQGALLVPAFSLERTQIILSTIDRFVAKGVIEPIPVFLDSPLATRVTEIYKKHTSYLRDELQRQIKAGDDPFSFPSLRVTYSSEQSKTIEETRGAKVIIAGAGMSHGGRVRSHEKTYLPGEENELLLVGYQVPGSLGRRLQDGARKVTIDKKEVKVRARVTKTGGFSAHADRDDLLSFAEAVAPQEAFVVLGEMESASFLAQRLDGFLNIKATIPQEGERFELRIH